MSDSSVQQDVINVDRDMVQILYLKGRKFYLRLKRSKNGAGIDQPYVDFLKSIGIDRKTADKIFYGYLKKKYPELVKLIKENN